MARLDVLSDGYSGSKSLLSATKKADTTSFQSTQFVLAKGNALVTITGNNLAQNGEGDIVGGTITAIEHRAKGVVLSTLSGLSIAAVELAPILHKGNVKQFDQLAFRGDDEINGGTRPDKLAGHAGDDVISGGAGNDQLDGGDGDDTLDGGAGADRMSGGDGNDTYIVDDPGDRISEAKDGGTDTVRSSIDFKLANGLENLELTGSAAIDGEGNKADNRITGNSGANELEGGDGNDTLIGGAGADELEGGKGADRFIIDTTTGGIDTVDDFNVREGDILDLSELINYYGGDAANFVRLTGSAGNVLVEIDADGGANSFTPAARVEGNMGLDLSALMTAGAIVI